MFVSARRVPQISCSFLVAYQQNPRNQCTGIKSFLFLMQGYFQEGKKRFLRFENQQQKKLNLFYRLRLSFAAESQVEARVLARGRYPNAENPVRRCGSVEEYQSRKSKFLTLFTQGWCGRTKTSWRHLRFHNQASLLWLSLLLLFCPTLALVMWRCSSLTHWSVASFLCVSGRC